MPRIVPSQVVALIEQLFPILRKSPEIQKDADWSLNRRQIVPLMAIIELVEHVPDELLPIEASDYSNLIVGLSAIRYAISRWQTSDYKVTDVPGYEIRSPLALIHQALSTCADESPALATTKLLFISDKELRDSLLMDISSTNSSLANGEWKAATVLAGSVVEALLLWALQEYHPQADIKIAVSALVTNKTFKKKPEIQFDRWTLDTYIEVALELKIIDENTAKQARLAKDFRNLIHPGRAQRVRQTCDRATALSAAAAMEHIIRCLTH